MGVVLNFYIRSQLKTYKGSAPTFLKDERNELDKDSHRFNQTTNPR